MELVGFWLSRRRGLGRFKKPYTRRTSGPTIGERYCGWVRRHTSRRHRSARPLTLWPQLFTSGGPLDSVITAMEQVCMHRSCFNAAVCWCWSGQSQCFAPSHRLKVIDYALLGTFTSLLAGDWLTSVDFLRRSRLPESNPLLGPRPAWAALVSPRNLEPAGVLERGFIQSAG